MRSIFRRWDMWNKMGREQLESVTPGCFNISKTMIKSYTFQSLIYPGPPEVSKIRIKEKAEDLWTGLKRIEFL